MTKTYTLVIAHFGSTFWVRHTLEQVDRLGGPQIKAVVIIDQNRDGGDELVGLPGSPTVIQFPQNHALIEAAGHDHPYALNRAIRETKFTSSHVMIMDSDCFPVDDSWLGILDQHDRPHLAMDPRGGGLTHPCFMVFPVDSVGFLDFQQGLISRGIDSGRLVGRQLAEARLKPLFLRPTLAAWGKGHYYLERSVYHHGSGSFFSSNDHRLLKQANEDEDVIYRGAISEGRFSLTLVEKLQLLLNRKRKALRQSKLWRRASGIR